MAPSAVAVPQLATEPGYLFWAPPLSTLPVDTVVGSVFTDAWDAAWIPLGATDDGSQFNWQTSFDKIEAAEFLDPLLWKSTGREGSIAFALMNLIQANLKRAFNGGTVVVTGSTTTTMSRLTPPAAGAETRCMIGWESLDSTERMVFPQCVNAAQVSIGRRKGINKALIPVEYKLELPLSGPLAGIPWRHSSAGVARTGV